MSGLGKSEPREESAKAVQTEGHRKGVQTEGRGKGVQTEGLVRPVMDLRGWGCVGRQIGWQVVRGI